MKYHLAYLLNCEISFNLFTQLWNIIQLIYEIKKYHSTYLQNYEISIIQHIY